MQLADCQIDRPQHSCSPLSSLINVPDHRRSLSYISQVDNFYFPALDLTLVTLIKVEDFDWLKFVLIAKFLATTQ